MRYVSLCGMVYFSLDRGQSPRIKTPEFNGFVFPHRIAPQLLTHEDRIHKIVYYQKTLMIMNAVFGLAILGIIFPVMIVLQLWSDDLPCIPGSGGKERKYIDWCKTFFSTVAKLCKFIPLFLCLVITTKGKNYFQRLADAACSDAQTNEDFVILANKVLKVHDGNLQTLYIDLGMLALTILTVLMGIKKAKKELVEQQDKDFEAAYDAEQRRKAEIALQDLGGSTHHPTTVNIQHANNGMPQGYPQNSGNSHLPGQSGVDLA